MPPLVPINGLILGFIDTKLLFFIEGSCWNRIYVHLNWPWEYYWAFGNDIVFSETYSNKSFSIDGISGTIKHEGIYNIDIVTNKGRSSLTAQGYIDTQNKYLEGTIEFSFSDPNDIKRLFQIFGINIEENPITNLLIYRGKIDLTFEDGMSLLGPLPIGRAPKLK